jgi:hypothetical protein
MVMQGPESVCNLFDGDGSECVPTLVEWGSCLAGTKARCIALSQIGATSQEKKHPLQGPRGGTRCIALIRVLSFSRRALVAR